MSKPTVAYFSMEIGLNSEMKTYAGGLGVLAGDTLKTASDLEMPMVGVSLLYRFGYFKQVLEENSGKQLEEQDVWDFEKYLILTDKKFSIQIQSRKVVFQIWKYEIKSETGFVVPIFFLDSDLDDNIFEDRCISWNLYTKYQDARLRQEIALGIGGIKALEVLGYPVFDKYHLNESHAAFALLALEEKGLSKEEIRSKTVFTTHTPVWEGHRGYDLDWYKNYLEDKYFQMLDFTTSSNNWLSLTNICLSLSGYVNGVSKKHAEVSTKMFPNAKVNSITNGVHLKSWISTDSKNLYDKYLPGWMEDNSALRNALSIPLEEIKKTHTQNKEDLFHFIDKIQGRKLNADIFTIGFARRVDGYKRADLIFKDLEYLKKIAKNFGGLQLIFSGKSFPDITTNEISISNLYKLSKSDDEFLKVVFLENYNMEIAKLMVAGSDLWLNNPLKPLEASGTSGMKAALNGVPNFSVLDGWWIEGWIEGVTGWSLGENCPENDEKCELGDLYSKLENIILPLYYENKTGWEEVCRNTVSLNASYFNTQRMLLEYLTKAYLN